MRTPGEVFGLMAYLFVMYGGFPDRAVIDMAYGYEPGEDSGSARGKLRVVGRTKQPRRTASRARAERAA